MEFLVPDTALYISEVQIVKIAQFKSSLTTVLNMEAPTADAANFYILFLHPALIALASDGPVKLQEFPL